MSSPRPADGWHTYLRLLRYVGRHKGVFALGIFGAMLFAAAQGAFTFAAKLLVEDGHSVLDIGCGFGGMGLYLARTAGARATACNAMFPPAPGRLSIMIGCPRRCESASPMSRAKLTKGGGQARGPSKLEILRQASRQKPL